jgi:hypothetical protein
MEFSGSKRTGVLVAKEAAAQGVNPFKTFRKPVRK